MCGQAWPTSDSGPISAKSERNQPRSGPNGLSLLEIGHIWAKENSDQTAHRCSKSGTCWQNGAQAFGACGGGRARGCSVFGPKIGHQGSEFDERRCFQVELWQGSRFGGSRVGLAGVGINFAGQCWLKLVTVRPTLAKTSPNINNIALNRQYSAAPWRAEVEQLYATSELAGLAPNLDDFSATISPSGVTTRKRTARARASGNDGNRSWGRSDEEDECDTERDTEGAPPPPAPPAPAAALRLVPRGGKRFWAPPPSSAVEPALGRHFWAPLLGPAGKLLGPALRIRRWAPLSGAAVAPLLGSATGSRHWAPLVGSAAQ